MPARRTALVVLPFLALTGCGPVTLAGSSTTVTDTPALNGPVGQVQLDVGSGDVLVTVDPAAGAPSLTRRVTYRDQRPGDTTGLDAGRLTLRGCDVDDCSVDYQLRVPSAVPVSGDGGSGDIELHGVGPVDVTAGSGSVRVDGATGSVHVRVGSGDVRGRDLAGEVRAEAGSGDVELSLREPESVTAATGSGSVTLTVPPGPYAVRAQTQSGEVHSAVPSTPGAPHTLTAEADSGDVDVRTG